VIGLGLVGQLVVQLLVASGVRVVGLDPDEVNLQVASGAEVVHQRHHLAIGDTLVGA